MKKKIKFTILIFCILLLTACNSTNEITKKALDYFCSKYDINRKDIKITNNNLYTSPDDCVIKCTDNLLYIEYNGEKYRISYDMEKQEFADSYQLKEIQKALDDYFNQRFNYADNLKLDDINNISGSYLPHNKYNGDIVEYLKDPNTDLEVYIILWLKATSKEEAAALHQQYSDDIVNELESLSIDYRILISQSMYDTENAYYYYQVNGNTFKLKDRVENKNYDCKRDELVNGKC